MVTLEDVIRVGLHDPSRMQDECDRLLKQAERIS